MDALIHLAPENPLAALLDIAGKPLLLRQIQWLRAAGAEHILVELPPTPDDARVRSALSAEPLGEQVRFAESSGVSPFSLASDPDFNLSPRVILLPGDVLGDGDILQILLRARADSAVAELAPPGPELSRLGGARVSLVGPVPGEPAPVRGPGWGARLRDADDAFALSLALLDGRVAPHASSRWGVQVHATRVSSGVWVARGAEVHPSACLVRPVFIGENAVIAPGAVVGPAVLVGPQAVVGPDARVLAAVIEPDAAVPPEARIAGARVVQASPRRPLAGAATLALALLCLLATAALVFKASGGRSASLPASTSLSSHLGAP